MSSFGDKLKSILRDYDVSSDDMEFMFEAILDVVSIECDRCYASGYIDGQDRVRD